MAPPLHGVPFRFSAAQSRRPIGVQYTVASISHREPIAKLPASNMT